MKLGIDLGGSHISMGIVDSKGLVIEKTERRLFDKEKADIKEFIKNYIIDNFKIFSEKYEITNIGIAVPGTVNESKIIKCVNLGLSNYEIVQNLKEFIDLPIKLRNDAKCAAIAEYKYGSLKKYKRSIFITLGTGVGGAVIYNGELLDTGDLPGCEFGHMIIQKNGIKCNCGKYGCFERYCSMKAFKVKLRDALGLDENTSGEELLKIIRKNIHNEKINYIIDEYIEYLSVGISNLINVFEPEAIGIGGSFVYFSDILLEKLKKNLLQKPYLFNKREDLIIIAAEFKNDAGIVGSSL